MEIGLIFALSWADEDNILLIGKDFADRLVTKILEDQDLKDELREREIVITDKDVLLLK